MPTVLISDFHRVWTHLTLPFFFLSGGMVHLPHRKTYIKCFWIFTVLLELHHLSFRLLRTQSRKHQDIDSALLLQEGFQKDWRTGLDGSCTGTLSDVESPSTRPSMLSNVQKKSLLTSQDSCFARRVTGWISLSHPFFHHLQ